MPNWIFLHPLLIKLWITMWVVKMLAGMGIVTYAAWKAKKEDENGEG